MAAPKEQKNIPDSCKKSNIITPKLNKLSDNLTGLVHMSCQGHVCHLHVQGHQWFADTMKIDAKAHGKPLGQVSNLNEIPPAVVLRKHLCEQLNTYRHDFTQTCYAKENAIQRFYRYGQTAPPGCWG